MPYSKSNKPSYIQALPLAAQNLFINAFNHVYNATNGDEDQARRAGWANVKRKFKKVGGSWIKKKAKK